LLICHRESAFLEGWSVVDNAAAENTVGRATLAKITLRLIPFMFVLYIVALLDRVNVGFAALQMNEDLGFSDTVYGIGAGIFFIGYFVFETPSNLIMEEVEDVITPVTGTPTSG